MKHSIESKIRGLENALTVYGSRTSEADVAIINGHGRYVVRAGDRFLALAEEGNFLVNPGAAMDPEWPGVIHKDCRWTTFNEERAERWAEIVRGAATNEEEANATAETLENACANALATLR